MFKKLAMFYQKGVSTSLLQALTLKNQPPIQGEFSKFCKIKTSHKIKKKYPLLADILNNPDIETQKGDDNGKILPNSDLGIVEEGHYQYLFKAAQLASLTPVDHGTSRGAARAGEPRALLGRFPAQKVWPSARGCAPLSAPATEKAVDKVSQLKKTLFGADTSISPLKLIALLKASYLGELGAIGQENAVLCGSGHWVRVNELQGDHVFPGSTVLRRFFHVFGGSNDISNSNNDPLNFVSEFFKCKPQKKEHVNKAFLMAHYLDAKNLMPLCEICNRQKNKGYLSWFMHHPKYGEPFISSYFPLNYSTIVPRTSDNQGLGDAAMMYLLTQHAIQISLVCLSTPRNEINSLNSYNNWTEHKKKTFEDAVKRLSTQELEQLRGLFEKF